MDKLITDHQFAEYLGINVRTLRRKIQANKIAITYIPGHQMRFRPKEIERYIETLEITTNGSGRVSKAAKPKKLKSRLIMTDEEAQSFFAGIERDSEGVLASREQDS